MATRMKVGDATYYQGKPGVILALPLLLGETGREQGVVMEYPLPASEADSSFTVDDAGNHIWQGRPKVTLEIDPDTGKPTGRKIEEPWVTAKDGPRMARTTCYAADLRWDTGRKAWVVFGHGLRVPGGGYYPDASHPENLKDDKPGDAAPGREG